MENADKPINPSISIKISDTEFFEYNLPNKERQYSGLTKREYFAGLAMQGMITNIKISSMDGIEEIPSNIASWSLIFADELLKQLEEK